MTIVLAISPIALTFAFGWLCVATGLLKRENWAGIEALSFRVLIPAILIHAIATADLSPEKIGPLAAALVLTIFLTGLAVLALRLVWSKDVLSGPSLSTLFQTSTRWNAFISLTAADLLIGSEGVLLIAIPMAVLIPLINVGNILALAALCSGTTGPRRILRIIVTNPLVLGCVIGLALNALPFDPPVPMMEALDIVGRAALGVGLLAVGAGIVPKRLLRVSAPVLVGAVARPWLVPALFLGFATFFGLSPTETLAGILVCAVPAATNGYIVAKAMGGDAELYADILIWQTFLSMLAIPFYAALVL
jgi:malonate transporter and related proteins